MRYSLLSKSFLLSAALLCAGNARAQVRTLMEGIPSSNGELLVSTTTRRVDIATTTYVGHEVNVGLHVSSNVVIDSAARPDACVFYASGTITCLGVTLSGAIASTVTVVSPLSGIGSSFNPVALTGAIPTGQVNLSTVSTQFATVGVSTAALSASTVTLAGIVSALGSSTNTFRAWQSTESVNIANLNLSTQSLASGGATTYLRVDGSNRMIGNLVVGASGNIALDATAGGVNASSINLTGAASINAAGSSSFGGVMTAFSSATFTGPSGGIVGLGEWTAAPNFGVVSANGLMGTNANGMYSIAGGDLYINRQTGQGIGFRENNGANQLYVQSGGNVGIGVTPSYLLDVEGTTSGNIIAGFLNSSASGYGVRIGAANGSSGDYLLRLTDDVGNLKDDFLDTGEVHLAANGGNVGIGTLSPAVPLDVVGNIFNEQGAVFTDTIKGFSGGSAGLVLTTNTGGAGGISFLTELSTSMYLTGTGNLGIGTVAPATALDVNGSAQFGSAYKSTFTATGALNILNNDLIPLAVSGRGNDNVRIEVVEPLGGGTSGISANGVDMIARTNASGTLKLSTNAGDIILSPNRNVGIGTPTPGSTLDDNGDATIRGQLTVVGGGTVTFQNSVFSVAGGFSLSGGVLTNTQNINAYSDINVGNVAPALTLSGGSGEGSVGFNNENGQAPAAGTGFVVENNQSDGELLFFAEASTGATGTPPNSAIVLALGNPAAPSVAINSTVLDATNFNVNGSAQFGGFLGSISTFNGAGFLTIANNAGIAFSGPTSAITGVSSVTAAEFFGDASHLTGIPSGACEQSYTALGVPISGAIVCNGNLSGASVSSATASASYAGPGKNVASGSNSVAFGSQDTASGQASAVFGLGNNAGGLGAFVAGQTNSTNGSEVTPTICGGESNTVGNGGSAWWATACGGFGNYSGGFGSWASGFKSSATAAGSWVWADYYSGAIAYKDHGANTFNVRATGGVYIDSATVSVMNGVVVSSTPVPSISCNNGTGVLSANSGSQSGSFAAGTLATSCTVTFASGSAFPKTPSCFCNGQVAGLIVNATAMSTTALTCGASTALTGDTINYFCWSQP